MLDPIRWLLLKGGKVVIQGTYTTADLTAATWTNMRPRRSIGIAGIVIVALFFLALWSDFARSRGGSQGWQLYLGFGAPIYLALVFGLWLPYRIRRTFKQRKDLQRSCSFTATPEGLRFASEGVEGVKPWGDYLKWREGRKVLLLYISDGHFQMIPKRFFESGEALSAFRTLLESKIGQSR